MKVYVATSWKNEAFPDVVNALRAAGHEVYDFRDANRAFNWSQINPSWDRSNPVLSAADLQKALMSPLAGTAFDHDKNALDWADAGVLVMPCGRSAHLEAGYLIGRGKPVCILLADNERPDLMHRLGTCHTKLATILWALREADPRLLRARDLVETIETLVAIREDLAKRFEGRGNIEKAREYTQLAAQSRADADRLRTQLLEVEASMPLPQLTSGQVLA